MIHGIHHIGLTVANLAQSVRFFQDAFGLAVVAAPAGTPTPHAAQAAIWLRAPNTYLELLQFDQPGAPILQPVNQAGITHVCVQSADMQALYQQTASMGASFHCAPLDLGTGNQYCYARDREHRVIELEALPYAPSGQSPWIAHVGLATADLTHMASFYQGLLGGICAGGQTLGPNPRFDQITALAGVVVRPNWIIGQNVTIELWQFLSPATMPSQLPELHQIGYSHICFEVEQITAVQQQCLAAGASLVEMRSRPVARSQLPVEQSAEPQAEYRSLLVRDPDGNLIELLEPTGLPTIADLSQPGLVAQVAQRQQKRSST